MSALEQMRVCECGHRPGWHLDAGSGSYNGEPLTYCRHQGRAADVVAELIQCSCFRYRESDVPNTKTRCTCGHTYGQHLTGVGVDRDGAAISVPAACEPYAWETPRHCPCVEFTREPRGGG